MRELAAGQRTVGQRPAPNSNDELKAKSHHPKVMAFIGETRKSSPYMAERTGLEPATPGVTGRYSNQLNYHSW